MKNIEKNTIYFIQERKQNELMSKKYKKVYMALNYIEQLLVLASAVSRCVSISAFTSLVDIPIGIVSSAVVLKIGAITTGIKKYKLII